MNQERFQRLVRSSSFNRRQKYLEFLDSMPLLKESMNEYERSQVADALKTLIFSEGDCIFRQNEMANGMYFIETGTVDIVYEECDLKRILNKLKTGDYFGELALVKKAPRSASAFASSQCKLAFLEINAFERLMGPCIELLKRKIISYKWIYLKEKYLF